MNDFAALKASEITEWDRQVDVIVVGCGAAGVSAAIEARVSGAEVLALEAAGEPGGTSAMSSTNAVTSSTPSTGPPASMPSAPRRTADTCPCRRRDRLASPTWS